MIVITTPVSNYAMERCILLKSTANEATSHIRLRNGNIILKRSKTLYKKVRGEGYDIGLIMLLAVIGDLRDTDASMNNFWKTVVLSKLIAGSVGGAVASSLAEVVASSFVGMLTAF